MLEPNIRDLSVWTGTGTVENSGDAERLALASGEYMESEVVEVGLLSVIMAINVYQSGDAVAIKYRTHADPTSLLSEAWLDYAGEFESLGYVQMRLESTF